MPVGAALAVASVGGAIIGSNASHDAAQTQAAAAQQSGQYQLQAAQLAAQLQLGMFNTIRGDLSAYRGVGASALPGYYRLLGLAPPAGAAPAGPASSTSTAMGGGSLTIPGMPNAAGGVGPGMSYANGDDFGGGAPGTMSAPFTGGTQGLPMGVGGGAGAGGLVIPGVNAPAAGAAAAAPALGSVNWGKLLQDRPDVMAEYQRLVATADRNSPWFSQHGLDKGPEGFAQWWYANKPAADTYSAPTWSQADLDQAFPQPTGTGATPTPAPGTGTPGAGPNGPSLTGEAGTGTGDIQAYLETLPGYQFAKQQGIRAVTNSLSAKGFGKDSGPLGKGLARFVTGLADSTYQSQLDRLSGAVTTGQNAATQTGTLGTSAAGGAAGSLVGGAGAYGSSLTGAANAIAAGQIGSANAISGGINGLSNAYLTSRVLGQYGGGGFNFTGG